MNSPVRLLTVALATLATLLGAVAPALATDHLPERGVSKAAPTDTPLVLAGVAGLQWSDVDPSRTPNLWRLVGGGSVASVSVRTLTPTCPVDAWLTLSAGGRVVAESDDRETPAPDAGTEEPAAEPALGCPGLPALATTSDVRSVTVPGWSGLAADDPIAPRTAEPGALGTLADEARTCATAVGPGAAVATALPGGVVPRYVSDPARLTGADLAACPVTVVDLGTLPDAAAERTEALETLDGRVGALAERLPRGGRLVVAGVSDTPLGPSDLQVVVDWTAPGGEPTWLTSTSSRWPGVVVLADLSATVAAALVAGGDLEEGSRATAPFTGSALERGEARRLSVARTVENRRYLGVLTETVPQMTPVLVGTLAVADVLVVSGLLLSRRRAAVQDAAGGRGAAAPRRHRRRLALAVLAVASALPVAASLATLARWWVWTTPVTTLALALASSALAVALAAWWLSRLLPASPWRLPTTLAGLTWLVLTIDGLTGTTLQQGSLLGPAPSLGARFYGFSNTVFAVYAVAGLVLAAGVAAMLRRRGSGAPSGGRVRAATVMASVVGVVTVLVDGLPPFGADLGGILALVPGFAVLVLGVAGVRVTWRRLLGIGAATVGLVLVVAVVDWATGPSTHLGGFVQSVLDGHVYGVIAGKAAGAWATVANPGGALVLVVAAALAWALLDPERWRLDGVAAAYADHPLLRRLVVALVTTAGVGTLVNDSGIAIAMFAALVATPLLLSGPLEHAERPGRVMAVPEGRPAAGRGPRVAATGGMLVGVCGTLLVALLLGAAALPARGLAGAGDVTGPGAPVVEGEPVVLIGTQGLRWDDVTPRTTPALWELLRDGASATGVTPSVTGASGDCVAAGWLGLSSGRSPVTGSSVDGVWTCQPWSVEARGEGAVVEGWDDLVGLQARSEFRPRLGVLGAALAVGEVCTTAVGPGAALALAGRDGTVGRYRDLDTALADPQDSFGCPVTVVDAGTAPYHPTGEGSTSRPAPADATTGDEARAEALRAVDATVGRVLRAAPEDATVLVLDVGNPAPARPALGIGLADADAGDAPAYLTTAATRWLGVVRLLDVPTTLVEGFGVPRPVDVSGAPLTLAQERPSDTADTVAELAGITHRDHSLRVTTGTVTTLPAYVSLVALGLVVLLLPRWRRAGRARSVAGASRALDTVLLVCASVPAATFLMSAWAWWRLGNPTPGLWTSLLASTAVVALVGALAPRRPAWAGATAVATLTFAVLTLDAVLGTPLHRGSPLGSAPTLGGRYYGFGNPTYSVYAVAAVFCAAGLATLVARRWNQVAGAVVAGVIGLVTLVVTVWPTFGVDVGGGLVLLPVFVVLVLGVLGARVTWRRLLVAGGAGVLLVALIGVLDWLRPPDERSHLGAFVQSVLDGTALETVLRKAGYALRSLSGGVPAWLSLAVLVAVALALWGGRRLRAAWLLRAEESWPLLRHVLVALLVAGVGGALVNDYGIRVVTIMLFAAVPLVGLVALRTDDARAAAGRQEVAPSAPAERLETPTG